MQARKSELWKLALNEWLHQRGMRAVRCGTAQRAEGRSCNAAPAGSHREDRANLGEWESNQRWLKKKMGELIQKRGVRLEEIGFKWALTSPTWDRTSEPRSRVVESFTDSSDPLNLSHQSV
jgi:hypothetical protein